MNHPAVTDHSITALTLSVRRDKLHSLTFKLCIPGTATVSLTPYCLQLISLHTDHSNAILTKSYLLVLDEVEILLTSYKMKLNLTD